MQPKEEYRTIFEKKSVKPEPKNKEVKNHLNKTEIFFLVILVGVIYVGLAVLIYSITHGYHSFPNQ